MISLYDSMTYGLDWAITSGIPQSLSAFSLVTKLEKTENWHLGLWLRIFKDSEAKAPAF